MLMDSSENGNLLLEQYGRFKWRDETSQLLQDAGFEDASKYLDAAWEL